MSEILTVKEAAEFAGVTRQAIYIAIWEHRLNPVRMLNKLGVPREEIKRFKRTKQVRKSNGHK